MPSPTSGNPLILKGVVTVAVVSPDGNVVCSVVACGSLCVSLLLLWPTCSIRSQERLRERQGYWFCKCWLLESALSTSISFR